MLLEGQLLSHITVGFHLSEEGWATVLLRYYRGQREAHQAPLSMGFPRQGYWRGLQFPSPGDLSNPGIKPHSPALQADSLPSEPPGKLEDLLLMEVSQLCPTLCDPMDYTVHGILQARILEWVAFPFSRGSSPPRD